MQQSTKAGTPQAAPAQDARLQLILKQTELRDQLKELASRRNSLLEQRAGASPPQADEIRTRISVIDKRSAQLETQLFATNDAIANGYGGPGPALPPPVDESAPQVSTGQAQDEAIRDAVSGAVDDAVFGAFATVTTTMLAFYVVWRGIRRFIWKRKVPVVAGDNSAQIEKLQQSMDVIAIEVERISEAQRFTAKMLNDRVLGAGEAQPVSVHPREPARAK